MRLLICWLASFLFAVAAHAAGEPLYAPAPEWVKPIALPVGDEPLGQAPVRQLLMDQQVRFGPDESIYYAEIAMRIDTPQGLSAGSLILPWHPDFGDLTIHKVAILRGGETIDVLADGQKFVTLRRESNLEMSMLDGILTAVMQPEGLEVGDTLNLAFSISRSPKSIAFKPENMIVLAPTQSPELHRIRHIWPKSMPVEWRGTGALDAARLQDRGDYRELEIVLEDVRAPTPPEGAPPRFALASMLQASGYRDWAEVSALLAPAFAEAATLAPDSPLRREAAKIASASADPKERAIAALRLVQDRVRYVALAMNEGGYIPASADETWGRRFADCKGKTAMLIALLGELGIEAQPVLVSTGAGDMLDGLLPSATLFDHVVVRAVIDGETYWLDGTRIGDRDLADLRYLPFGRGLPLQAAGATLVSPALVPPESPFTHLGLAFDASKGIDLPAPTTGEYRMRGPYAGQYQAMLSTLSPDDAQKHLREFWTNSVKGLEPETVNHRYDDEESVMTFTVAGKTDMGWYDTPDRAARRYQFDQDTVQWTIDLEREAGGDAPFAIPFPTYVTSTETIRLPRDGKGFTIEGEDLNVSAAGAQISRRLEIDGDTAIASSSFRTIAREIPAGVAAADTGKIAESNEAHAYIRAPSNYSQTAAERGAALDLEPDTAQDYVDRGAAFLENGRYSRALADLDRAIELDPKSSFAFANRGIVHFWMGRPEQAVADFDRASAIEPNNFVTFNGRGLIHSAAGRIDEAIAAFTRAIDSEPGNEFARHQRIALRMRKGDSTGALAEVEQGLALAPNHIPYLNARVAIHEENGDWRSAITDLERIIAEEPAAIWAYTDKAELLLKLEDPAGAVAAFDAAAAQLDRTLADVDDPIAPGVARADLLEARGDRAGALAILGELIDKNPDNMMLRNQRCWMRAIAGEELDRALADCDAAIEIDPTSAPALDSRGFVKLRMGRLDEAIADFDRALNETPRLAASLFGRGVARLRNGDEQAGHADIVAAEALDWTISDEYAGYGVTVESGAARP